MYNAVRSVRWYSIAIAITSCAIAYTFGPVGLSADEIDFARDIQPILTEKCLKCHSGEKPEGNLLLSSHQSLLGKGSSEKPAVVPGKPDESELIARIVTSDADMRMPPGDEKPLTSEQVALLKRWVAAGAPWSRHWSFRPLSDAPVPELAQNGAAWARNAIDHFVLERLNKEHVSPSPEADRATLIKRLYYDLVGLPPELERVDRFLADNSPTAYEQLVNELLESPHFGERWARHWLDIAHFADSDGFEKDRARPDAYLFRDWVINSINTDQPFDQFTIEQLAGDLLPNATGSQRIATAFLRQTLTNEEGGVDQEEYRIAAVFDRTETVGQAWLGLTVGCVRCHTHKYDPLPHEDYYKFFAFFNNADEAPAQVALSAKDLEAYHREAAPLEARLDARFKQLAADELRWETEQRELLLAGKLKVKKPAQEQALELINVKTDTGSLFKISASKDAKNKKNASGSSALAESTDAADKENLTIDVGGEYKAIERIRLVAMSNNKLPKKGPGRSSSGNFVITGFKLFKVAEDGKTTPLEIRQFKADFVQAGFSIEQLHNSGAASDGSKGKQKSGWAVGGKIGSEHWLDAYLTSAITLASHETLRIEIEQQYGGSHILGQFRIAGFGRDEGDDDAIDEQSIVNSLEMYPEKRVANTKAQLFEYYVKKVAKDKEVADLRDQLNKLRERYDAKLTTVRTIASARLPRTTYVFHRGDFLSPGNSVTAATPAVLAAFEPRGAQADRLDLAKWLVSSKNDLTPRVAVNHIWQHLFGYGLVRTPSDFGARGEPPTHPELLDWLARTYRDQMKWSRKELIRLIVQSATYRQASHQRADIAARDPRNSWLWKQNRFRVESEIIRDLNLSASGLLSRKIGGPSVFPPMPEELAKLSYANSFDWKNSEGEDRYRRGLYTFFKRTIPHPNLMTFDSPDANVACMQREPSNTPLQSLTLLNNAVHHEAAQGFAARVLNVNLAPTSLGNDAANRDEDRLRYAMRICVARVPNENELSALKQLLETSRKAYAQDSEATAKIADKHRPESVEATEFAAWIATVRVIMNLDEFITRE